MAFTSSRSTGGEVCIKAWINGRVFRFIASFDADSDEYGTDCCARIAVSGANQLNKSRHRLEESSDLAIAMDGRVPTLSWRG
jgi:hypothetical protein